MERSIVGVLAAVVLPVLAVTLAAGGAFGQETSELAKQNEELKKKNASLEKQSRDLDARLSKLESTVTKDALTQSQKDEVKKLVGEMIKDAKLEGEGLGWAKNLKFYGDLRLRYENQSYNYGQSSIYGPGHVTAAGFPQGSSRAQSRNRFYYSLHFGMTKTWQDDSLGDFEVGFRLASGDSSDPTGTDQTMGNPSNGLGTNTNQAGFDKRPIWIDLAYAKWSGKDALKGLTITGGKMLNPFYTTDMMWSTDVNPEGVWAQYNVPGIMNGDLVPFVGAGLFIVREVGQSVTLGSAPDTNAPPLGKTTYTADTTMWAYDAGVIWNITKDVKWTSAFTYYQWLHSDGYLWGGSSYNSNWRGNMATPPNGLDFGVVNLTNKIDFVLPIGSYRLPMQYYIDWAYNTAENWTDGSIAQSTEGLVGSSTYGRWYNSNLVNQRNAIATGLKAGKNEKKGDWSAGYSYKYIQANAFPGYWSDTSFGGTNRKGHVMTFAYNLMDDLVLGSSLYLTDPIYSEAMDASMDGTGSTVVPISGEGTTCILQVDLTWKF